MIVSISQPTLFPWLGYFDIIKNSDIFVFLDNVKFEKRSWQMRNRLKEINKSKEQPVWIKLPTHTTQSNIDIKDVEIDNKQDWKLKHVKTFQALYGNEYKKIQFLNSMYDIDWNLLSDFNCNFIIECSKFLNIKTKFIRASELGVTGKKSELLLNICTKFDTTEYLSTIGSKDYLNQDAHLFNEKDIKIKYHQYQHPKYSQKGNVFVEQLSILDLIFNENKNSVKYF